MLFKIFAKSELFWKTKFLCHILYTNIFATKQFLCLIDSNQYNPFGGSMSGNFLDDSGEMIGRDSQGIRIETDLAMSIIMSEKQKDEFDQYVVFFFRLAWMHGISAQQYFGIFQYRDLFHHDNDVLYQLLLSGGNTFLSKFSFTFVDKLLTAQKKV